MIPLKVGIYAFQRMIFFINIACWSKGTKTLLKFTIVFIKTLV